MKFLYLISFLFLVVGCNNSKTSNQEPAKTRADSLMDEVMEGHNRAMAKMDRIDQTKKKIQHFIDSVSSLTTPVQKNSVQYRMQLDSVFNRLTFANYAMEKWMNEFNMDSLKNNEKEQVKYLESEKSKITNVNEAIINGLQKADSLLKSE